MSKPDTKDRKRSIYDAALRLFLRDGFDAVRVDDILLETGLSKGGFYHHFKSREDILREIVVEETTNFVAGLDETLAEDDPVAALKQLFSLGSVSLGADSGVLNSLQSFAGLIVYLDELERQLALQLKPRVAKIIREGVTSGVFRKIDDTATAEIFLAVNNHGNRSVVLGTLDTEQLNQYNHTAIQALGRLLGVEDELADLISRFK